MSLELAPAVTPLKLDLGCGKNTREGYEGVDLWEPTAKHKLDLCKFPWPWADSSVDALHTSHFLEHVAARNVEAADTTDPRYLGRDMLNCIMDEAWRILRPGGEFKIIVPNARSNRAFQDPTHRRFWVAETFYYFNADWRKMQGLDHYEAQCNFDVQAIDHSSPEEMGLYHPEAQTRMFTQSWNVIWDWIATLRCRK